MSQASRVRLAVCVLLPFAAGYYLSYLFRCINALIAGDLVADHACVVAIGSHEPDARETDDRLARRATVVFESRASALREAGDVIAAGLGPDELVTLRDLVAGAEVPPGPRLFKSTGMAWEDAVVAGATLAADGPP